MPCTSCLYWKLSAPTTSTLNKDVYQNSFRVIKTSTIENFVEVLKLNCLNV